MIIIMTIIHALNMSHTQSHPCPSYLQCCFIQSARAVIQRLSCQTKQVKQHNVFQLPISLSFFFSFSFSFCFLFCFAMIVANSSPLPNIDHTMCLTGGRDWGGAGGFREGVSTRRSPNHVAVVLLVRCAS